jgi:hypothetical protein
VARFVHITTERNAAAVMRAGLRPGRLAGGGHALGVYGMPVLPRYEITHQWAREMKRWRGRTLAAVTFLVPDDELVLVGRYNQGKTAVTAAQAAGLVRDLPDPRGWEVIVPRAVPAKDIVRVRSLRRVTGWRYFPDAHGRAPCGCPACTAGEPFQRRLRAAMEGRLRAGA